MTIQLAGTKNSAKGSLCFVLFFGFWFFFFSGVVVVVVVVVVGLKKEKERGGEDFNIKFTVI